MEENKALSVEDEIALAQKRLAEAKERKAEADGLALVAAKVALAERLANEQVESAAASARREIALERAREEMRRKAEQQRLERLKYEAETRAIETRIIAEE